MDIYTASEVAYKNGYKQGQLDMLKILSSFIEEQKFKLIGVERKEETLKCE